VRPALPKLHAITDERVARRPDLEQVAAALAAGAPGLALHARGHTLSGLEHYQLAVRLRSPPSATVRESVGASVRLFVNDRLDVALAADADGVQLGTGSLDVAEARRLGPSWLVGRSVHAVADALAARAAGADYLLAGPVFPTPTHPAAAPLGLVGLGAIVAVGLPVIAIGGVTAERIESLRAAGAWGAAAIRALWDAADPRAAARAMEDVLQR
jgi:thiamine-phosphate pyrophosphorylase